MQNKILIRCHRLGDIMTGSSKNMEVAKTKGCTDYLKELFRSEKWKRRKIITNKFVQKGLSEEEAGITLYSRFKKIPLFKNTIRYQDELLTGEPDITQGEGLRIDLGIDIKCSWSFDTFPFEGDKLDSDYYWQAYGYMMLTGAKKWTIAYVLVNAPANLIDKEKKSLWYNCGCVDLTHPVYVDGCKMIERNMIYDMAQFRKDNPQYILETSEWKYDIPLAERVCEFIVERDEAVIEKITARLKEAYTYLNNLK